MPTVTPPLNHDERRRRSPATRKRSFRRYPHLRQLDETDCGAACLAMVSRYYGTRRNISELRDAAGVGRDGANLRSLAAAAESIGFSTRMLRATFEQLRGLDLPIIAHWEGVHFVVVYEIGKKHVVVADPAIGVIRMSHEEFIEGWTGFLLSLTPASELLQDKPTKTTFFRFLPYLRPHYRLLIEILIASVILEVLTLITPIFIQVVVDRVLVHQNVQMLNLMLAGMLVVGVFQTIITLLRDYFSIHVAQKLGLRFSSDLLRQLLRLPLTFFNARRTGDVMQLFEDNEEIQDVLTGKVITTLLDLMTMFLTIGLMFYYSVSLSVVALIAVPFYIIMTLAFTPALKRNNLKAIEQSARSNSHLIELVRGIATVKSYAAEDTSRWRQETHFVREAQVDYHDSGLDLALSGLSSAIDLFARLILFWYGAHLVIQGQLTLGQLMAFQTLVGMALGPITGLIGLWDELQEALISLQRLADVHDYEPEQPLDAAAIRLPNLRGAIELEGVGFRYHLDKPYILKEIDLKIGAGETIAIVGPSGSGKTTLINLVQRLYRPTEGRVFVDGFDLATADVRSLRRQISVVPQSPDIFSGTIRDNIALADPDAPLDRVITAATIAGAHGFIAAFPLNYETVIGEAGIRLSGGQLQRIAIARALLCDPQILILDEATSALDAETESSVQQSMRTILGERTALIIAHRLSTIKNADRIVVLNDGEIVEQGTHGDLVDRQGFYYQLVCKQAMI